VNAPPKPFFLQALDALKNGDRRGAAVLLERELREGNTAQKNLPSVAQLAAHIGEIDFAVQASRRAIVPGSVPSLLAYWTVLASSGRPDEAISDVRRQPVSVRNHPSVLHFRGTVANQLGRLDEAQELFRAVLTQLPAAPQSWFALAMVKTFKPGDPDIQTMEALERQSSSPPDVRASLCYGIGKAWEDCGDADRAFDYYSKGAALQRQQSRPDIGQFAQAADHMIKDFTAENLRTLAPSQARHQRSLFVTGLPRSGTTLTEQLLVAHSQVSDGAEVNLFERALMPTLGHSLANARAYQERSSDPDPWGEIARDYAHLIDVRFGQGGRIVDKSLGQSLLTGLMLHSLPDARVAWLRRSPEDVALSCFQTYFSMGLPWTWSLTDIADHMKIEDRLFEHWTAVFPERILAVPYEELVASPDAWTERLQQHFGLPAEKRFKDQPQAQRNITTASVGQVQQPISTERVGRSANFERQLRPFRDRYYA
jgi:tetratricopeptide (TPR) repeat protein